MELYNLIQLSNKLPQGTYKKNINGNIYEIEIIEKKDKINKIVNIKKNEKIIYNFKIQNLVNIQFRVTIYFNDYELTTLNYYDNFNNFFIRKDKFFLFKNNLDVNGKSFKIKNNLLYSSNSSFSELLTAPRIVYNLTDKKLYLYIKKYNKLITNDIEYSTIKVEYNLELLESIKKYNELLIRMKNSISNEIKNENFKELFETLDLPTLKTDYEEVTELLEAAEIYEENKDKLELYDTDNSIIDLISFMNEILNNEEYLTIKNIKKFIEETDLTDFSAREELINKLNSLNNKTKKLTLDS